METALLFLCGFFYFGWKIAWFVIRKDVDKKFPSIVDTICLTIAKRRSRGMPAAHRRRWYKRFLTEIRYEEMYTRKLWLALTFTYIEPTTDVRKLPPGDEWKPE